MQTLDPIQLRKEFVLRANNRIRREQGHEQHKDRDKRQRRKDKEAQDEFDDLIQVAVLATTEHVAQFQNRLDDYERQAVERILMLQQQRDQKLAERESLLEAAHTLPGGTRVFKTEDNQKVFDEHGTEIGADILSPDQIGDDRPKWDQFSDVEGDIQDIDEALAEAITFQEKIEALRSRSEANELTQDELDALEQELDDIVPDSFEHENAASEQDATHTQTEVGLGDVRDQGYPKTIKLPGQL
ncbi:hypothetical protein [Roseibium album]|uniref:hypothetical protein n=1 Tax=Roseibium album TaxID=311410 RepID=UPI003297D265